MSWSDGALRLRKPRIVELPRAQDRISYLFIDKVRVEQDRTGVHASWADGRVLSLPVGSLGALLLGPGTSVTSPALVSAARAGCTLLFVDSDSMGCYSSARSLASRADWLQAQARVWSDPDLRVRAARTLYRHRYGDLGLPEDAPLKVLRGIEGSRVKSEYRRLAQAHGFKRWGRETDRKKITDPVNHLLNLGNSILYSVALTACSALGCTPGLGVIHQGSANALLFDLADGFKSACTIPHAFEVGATTNNEADFRRRVRSSVYSARMLDQSLKLIDAAFGEHRHAADQDVLIDDEGFVRGRVNHSGSEDSEWVQ